MKHIYKRSSKRAFTLIELLIVIAIIGILFIVLVSRVDFATDKAKATGVQTDFRSFQVALETVSKENAGFASLGWNTGDDNGDRIRNSYDEGDIGAGVGTPGYHNGKVDSGEIWTGHKVYGETWGSVYTLVNPADNTDTSAFQALEAAINANLDPKLHITITPELSGTALTGNAVVSMANGAQDPWKKEYHGVYITNAITDNGADRGAFVIYSDGANGKWGSAHEIANGVVTVTVPGNNIAGKDDYSMVVLYTNVNGYGQTGTQTNGFSNNQEFLSQTPTSTPHLVGSGSTFYTSAPAALTLYSSVDYGAVKSLSVNGAVVDASLYTVSSDKKINLPIAFLETLDDGSHNISIEFENGKLNGLFNVKSPALNSFGFYYNQPYSAYVDYFGTEIIFIIKNDGKFAAVAVGGGTEYNDYVLNDDMLTLYSPSLGTVHLYVQDNGNKVYCPEIDTTFALGSNNVAADDDYFYVYSYTYGGYEVAAMDMSKSNYAPIQTGINGIDTVALADFAFYKSKLITAPVMPESIHTIGDYAFANCPNLVSFKTPDHVTYTGEAAFEGCTSLSSYVVSKNDTWISNSCFYGCINLTNVDFNNTTNLIQIGFEAFAYCSSLKQLAIPEAVTLIDSRAFYHCKSLEILDLSQTGITQLSEPFMYCESLRTLKLPKTLSNFDGNYILVHCYSLTDIQIDPENTSFIFENNGLYSKNKDVLYAYVGTSTEFTLPAEVSTIKQEALTNAYYLESINVASTQNGFTSMDGVLYHNGRILQYPLARKGDSYTLNSSWSSDAFNGVRFLKQVYIPDHVYQDGPFQFTWISAETIFVNDSHPYYQVIDGHLVSKDGKSLWAGANQTTTVVPGIQRIKEGAFLGKNKIETLIFSEGTEVLELYAVSGLSNLTTVILPRSLEEIHEEVFYCCTNLQTIIYNGTIEEWNAIEKIPSWHFGVPTLQVQCSDGIVYLEPDVN